MEVGTNITPILDHCVCCLRWNVHYFYANLQDCAYSDGLVCLCVYVYVYVYVCYVCEHRSLLSESENKKFKNSLVDCGICNRVSSFRKWYSVTFTYFSRVTILICLIIWNGNSFRKKRRATYVYWHLPSNGVCGNRTMWHQPTFVRLKIKNLCLFEAVRDSVKMRVIHFCILTFAIKWCHYENCTQ